MFKSKNTELKLQSTTLKIIKKTQMSMFYLLKEFSGGNTARDAWLSAPQLSCN